jgi:LacI family transcriptional regulator
MSQTQGRSQDGVPRPTPTLAEVARMAGVSKATASRALSDSSTRVDPDTAERVRLAARELRYTPNPHAQALARASSPSVGLLIHEVSNPFFSEIASGVLDEAQRHDRMVMICNTRRDPEQELQYVREMRALRLHAILVAGSEFVGDRSAALLEEELDEYRATGGRVALMRPHPVGAVVIPDTIKGGRLIAEHLMGLGHERIGVVSGPTQLATIAERRQAFEGRLAESGLAPVAVVQGHFSRDGGRRATEELLASHPDITAVFALNDLMAVGAVHAVHQAGLRVPEDISVAGFNDLPIASDVTPPLTTVRLPLREMGRRALEIALGGEDPDQPVVLDVTLIERSSTGPVG